MTRASRALGLLPILLVAAPLVAGPSATPPLVDRSPSDLALSVDGRWAVTANTTSDTASLVDLQAGKVAAEAPVGRHPFAVAMTRDGKRALVTNWLSDTVTLLTVSPEGLKPIRTVAVGDEPRGVAIDSSRQRAYVALGGEDAVAVLDLLTLKPAVRVGVGTEPWHLALSPDGSRLAVGNTRSQSVTVIDTGALKVDYVVPLRGHNLRHLTVSPDGLWAYVPHIAQRGFGTSRENIDNGWVVASRLSRVPLDGAGPREAIALDPRGKAVGDADGVAMSADGQCFALTAAGTHELLLYRQPLPFVAYGGPADHIEPELLSDSRRFRRVPLGGRPLGAVFTPDGRRVVVANYLASALQVVDFDAGSVTSTIPLGAAAPPSLARRGEEIFYDAGRSFNQWYSCGTCHTEGHTNGASFDTLNDGRYGNPKKTLSLRGVTRTGPWTWHGWQADLVESAHNSLTKSMQGPEPSPADLEALMAYLKTLDHVPGPAREAGGVKRGQGLFVAKGCAGCHAPPDYTTAGVFTVGLEAPEDSYKGFSAPALRGVGRRAPYLHDARAKTLEDVLSRHHRPSQLTGKPDFSPAELVDVVEFLKSL
jgi:YVTN family beta-propeller protein